MSADLDEFEDCCTVKRHVAGSGPIAHKITSCSQT